MIPKIYLYKLLCDAVQLLQPYMRIERQDTLNILNLSLIDTDFWTPNSSRNLESFRPNQMVQISILQSINEDDEEKLSPSAVILNQIIQFPVVNYINYGYVTEVWLSKVGRR